MIGGLLETFYFMFEADTSKIKTGLEAGKQSATELEGSLKRGDAAAQALGASFIETAKSASKLLVGTLALGTLKALSINSAAATNAFAEQNKALRLNISELDAWSKVVVASGGTSEEFTSKIAELKLQTRAPIEALINMADKFKNLSDIQAETLGKKLGLGPGLIEAMRQGKEGLQELINRQKTLGIVTKEQAEVAKKYKDQMRDTQHVYDDIQRRIATTVLPALTAFGKILERVAIWARDNKTFVLSFFGAISSLLLVIYLPALVKATVATFAFMSPWLLVGGAIAAVGAIIALLVDDVIAFLKGNKSMIGELAERWPIVGRAVHAVADAVMASWAAIKSALIAMGDLIITGPGKAFHALKNIIGILAETTSTKFTQLKGLLFEFGTVIMKVIQTIVQSVTSLSIFTFLSNAIRGTMHEVTAMADMVMSKVNAVMALVNRLMAYWNQFKAVFSHPIQPNFEIPAPEAEKRESTPVDTKPVYVTRTVIPADNRQVNRAVPSVDTKPVYVTRTVIPADNRQVNRAVPSVDTKPVYVTRTVPPIAPTVSPPKIIVTPVITKQPYLNKGIAPVDNRQLARPVIPAAPPVAPPKVIVTPTVTKQPYSRVIPPVAPTVITKQITSVVPPVAPPKVTVTPVDNRQGARSVPPVAPPAITKQVTIQAAPVAPPKVIVTPTVTKQPYSRVIPPVAPPAITKQVARQVAPVSPPKIVVTHVDNRQVTRQTQPVAPPKIIVAPAPVITKQATGGTALVAPPKIIVAPVITKQITSVVPPVAPPKIMVIPVDNKPSYSRVIPPVAPPKVNVLRETLIRGQTQVAQVNRNQLNSQTSNSISNSTRNHSNRTTNVNVGAVNVKSIATNTKQIASSVSKSLTDHLRSAADQYNDGVVA